MSRVKWMVLGCAMAGAGACFVLASPSANADDGRFVIQPAVYRVGSGTGGVTTQLVNHRYGGGGFSIGIYSGPRYGYGGGGGYYGGGYGGYYRPSYGYGYSTGWGGYPPGFNPGGYYYSAPSYGYTNYGYGGYYRGGWGCY